MTELFHCLSTSITLRHAIMPCFPQSNYARKNFKEKLCPACHAARTETAPAPHRAQRPTPHPVQSDLLWKHRNSHTSLLSNWDIVPRLPCKLPPLDWAIELWAITLPLDWASWATSCLLYHLTELVGLPLDYSTTWLSYSIVSYLLITLPFDWAIQLWASSWLLYLLTELFNCGLPLDYSTFWLSCSIVSYLLITLPLDSAVQLWATSWLLYHLTELFNCELPPDYPTADWAIQLWATSLLLYHLTELFDCEPPLSYPIVRNYGSF